MVTAWGHRPMHPPASSRPVPTLSPSVGDAHPQRCSAAPGAPAAAAAAAAPAAAPGAGSVGTPPCAAGSPPSAAAGRGPRWRVGVPAPPAPRPRSAPPARRPPPTPSTGKKGVSWGLPPAPSLSLQPHGSYTLLHATVPPTQPQRDPRSHPCTDAGGCAHVPTLHPRRSPSPGGPPAPGAQPRLSVGCLQPPEPLPTLTSAVGHPSGGAWAPSCSRVSMGGGGQGTAQALCKRGSITQGPTVPPRPAPPVSCQPNTPPAMTKHPLPWSLPAAASPGGGDGGGCPPRCHPLHAPQPPQQKGAAQRGPTARPATWARRARRTQELRSAPARLRLPPP